MTTLKQVLITFFSAQYFYNVQSLLLVDTAGVYATANTKYLQNPDTLTELLVNSPDDISRVLNIAMYDVPFLPKALLREQAQLMLDQQQGHKKMITRLVKLYKLYQPESFKMIAGSVEAPTLVIWGDKDKIIDVGVVKELTDYLDNEEPPVVLTNVGHSPILEAPERVLQAYIPFLQKAQKWHNIFKSAAPK